MKKMLVLLFALLLVPALCLAEDFSEAARAAAEAAHPEARIEAQETAGGVSLFSVLRGESRVLLIIEERDGQPALTIENGYALPDMELVPEGRLHLMLDTTGCALFISWDEPDAHFTLHAEREAPGRWKDVDLLVQHEPSPDGLALEQLTFVQQGLLISEQEWYDENGNPARPDRKRVMRLPVTEEFAERMLLKQFSLPEKLWLSPEDGLNFPLKAGETVINMDAQNGTTIFLIEEPDDTRTLHIWDWDGYEHREERSIPFGQALSLDTWHTGDGDVFVYWEGLSAYFTRGEDGHYGLSGIQGENGEWFGVGRNFLRGPDTFSNNNNGYIYGRREPIDLMTCDFDSLPATLEEAVSQMDQSAYALVHNPDPKDRLHLRVKPQKGAKSLGKFYNRTPVEILGDDGGTWVHVRVGTLEGYMMRKFLAFSEREKSRVDCAFEPLFPGSPQVTAAPVYAVPDESTDTIAVWKNDGSSVFVAGVVEEDWLIVLLPDGRAGYVPRADCWPGNG